MIKKKLLISACLIGENCKYNGGNNRIPALEKLTEKYELIPVCPEQLGGLLTPRDPSEILGDRVVNKIGKDVTAEFIKGAIKALKIAKGNNCFACLLKERSPSCGVNNIYDGSFKGALIKGSGITTQLLKYHGFMVVSEEEVNKLV